MTGSSALVAGVSWTVGSNFARHWVRQICHMVGMARRLPTDLPGLRLFDADLFDPVGVGSVVGTIRRSHLFITAQVWQATQAENFRSIDTIVRNRLNALRPVGEVQLVELARGLEHFNLSFKLRATHVIP